MIIDVFLESAYFFEIFQSFRLRKTPGIVNWNSILKILHSLLDVSKNLILLIFWWNIILAIVCVYCMYTGIICIILGRMYICTSYLAHQYILWADILLLCKFRCRINSLTVLTVLVARGVITSTNMFASIDKYDTGT